MKKKQTPSPRKGVPSKMKGRKMPPRAQIVRLARIASLLKRNSCPTAEKLLKEGAKRFGPMLNMAKEFFPDIDFSDVAAEVSAEQL